MNAMGASAVVDAGKPVVRIRGTAYPLILPTVRDPRLHLAAVIISLQVLGQTSFDFSLSIAQILISVLTCAVLEVVITFRTQRVLMWPASALLTGNGVAFILRVPGTEHGDWWSMNGWWIFAGTAAISLLSKYVIKFQGSHVFNPSNFGLVLCFLLLGPERADPLDFWWGPMSAALAVALVIITVGGLSILSRLKLLEIAVCFWLAFAGGLAVLAASGHEMTARWHLGPITGSEFWRALVFSPEILVFLFFMITDPRTIPRTGPGRRLYAVGIGLLAVVLIAPQTEEFWAKVAVLGALFIVCALRPLLVTLGVQLRYPASPARLGTFAAGGVVGFVVLVVLAGTPARPDEASASVVGARSLPAVTVLPSEGVATQLDDRTAEQIARDVVANLGNEADSVLRRDHDLAKVGASGARLASVWGRIDAGGATVPVPEYDLERMTVRLERDEGQGPPLVVADLEGTVELVTYRGTTVQARGGPARYRQTLELVLDDGRYLIVGSRGPTPAALATPAGEPAPAPATGLRLENVAVESGLRFRHGAFRFKTSNDPVAYMGGGLCWLDYDNDGWLDLYAVNSYSIEVDVARWRERGGTPRAALFRNERGKFVDVSRGSGSNVSLRGNGCVAADLNGDGHTDLYVTAAGYDALLWNRGDGTFVEGARAAGITTFGWHSGAAVGDVNGDGRPDLYVAGYADLNNQVPGSAGGFPSNYLPVRDRLYVNLGPDANGRSRFREVAAQAGVESRQVDHGLGVVFTDYNGDGRLDAYVANDTDAESPARERPGRDAAWVPAGGARGQRGRRRSPGGNGRRVRRLQPRLAPGPLRDELTPAAARSLRGPPGRVHRRTADLRACVRYAVRRMGRVVVRPRPRRRPGRGAGERRDPGPEPGPGRRASPGAREPRLEGSGRQQRRARRGPGQRPGSCHRGLRQRRRRRCRCQRDRRPADAAPELGLPWQLACRQLRALLAGRAGDPRARRRETPGARDAGREQLPLVGGPASALRARPGREGRVARRPAARRPYGPPPQRRSEPGRDDSGLAECLLEVGPDLVDDPRDRR